MKHKVMDLHCDSVFSLMQGKDLRQKLLGSHVDLPRLREGRVGLQVFAAYVPPNTPEAFKFTSLRLDAIEGFAKSHEDLTLVESFDDVKKALNAEKTGIMLSVENGLAIEAEAGGKKGLSSNLEVLRKKKVRILTLVHSEHLPWVASCTGTNEYAFIEGDEGKNPHLSRLGEKVLDAMNELGIIPDVSHCSEAAFWAVLKKAKKPIIASHSCCYSICEARRNLKDDQLKALGDSGGIAGVNFCLPFLSDPYRLAYEKNNRKPDDSVTVPHTIIADHIDHMVKIAGIDIVAIGSDFDGIPAAPDGVTGSDYFPVLEHELRTRGYSEESIAKIFNGNFLRVLSQWD